MKKIRILSILLFGCVTLSSFGQKVLIDKGSFSWNDTYLPRVNSSMPYYTKNGDQVKHGTWTVSGSNSGYLSRWSSVSFKASVNYSSVWKDGLRHGPYSCTYSIRRSDGRVNFNHKMTANYKNNLLNGTMILKDLDEGMTFVSEFKDGKPTHVKMGEGASDFSLYPDERPPFRIKDGKVDGKKVIDGCLAKNAKEEKIIKKKQANPNYSLVDEGYIYESENVSTPTGVFSILENMGFEYYKYCKYGDKDGNVYPGVSYKVNTLKTIEEYQYATFAKFKDGWMRYSDSNIYWRMSTALVHIRNIQERQLVAVDNENPRYIHSKDTAVYINFLREQYDSLSNKYRNDIVAEMKRAIEEEINEGSFVSVTWNNDVANIIFYQTQYVKTQDGWRSERFRCCGYAGGGKNIAPEGYKIKSYKDRNGYSCDLKYTVEGEKTYSYFDKEKKFEEHDIDSLYERMRYYPMEADYKRLVRDDYYSTFDVRDDDGNWTKKEERQDNLFLNNSRNEEIFVERLRKLRSTQKYYNYFKIIRDCYDSYGRLWKNAKVDLKQYKKSFKAFEKYYNSGAVYSGGKLETQAEQMTSSISDLDILLKVLATGKYEKQIGKTKKRDLIPYLQTIINEYREAEKSSK